MWVDGTNAANLNMPPGSGLYYTKQPDCYTGSGEVYLMADAGWATVRPPAAAATGISRCKHRESP